MFTLQGKRSDPILIDDFGLAWVDYQGKVGYQRNPITISDIGMDYYNLYRKTGDENAKERFLNVADWIKRCIDEDGICRNTFEWKTYDLTPPWQSAMAQGWMLKIEQRAYEITGLEEYRIASEKILQSFYLEVKDGGVTYKDNDGWWYEEYADVGGKEPRVLNGMMYATLDLYDYYESTGNQEAKFLFEKGVMALKNNLHLYDAPDNSGYTYYDRLRNPAWDYQLVHVTLANQLYNITGDHVFKEYADKWQKFRDWSSFVVWLKYPTNTMFLAFVINASAMFIVISVTTTEWIINLAARSFRKTSVTYNDPR